MGFRFTKDGLEASKQVGDDIKWGLVCNDIKVKHEVFNADGNCGYQVRFKDSLGKVKDLMIPAGVTTDDRRLNALVADAGLGRGPEIKALGSYFRGLTQERLLDPAQVTDRTGWTDGIYLLPDAVIASTKTCSRKIPLILDTVVDLRSLTTRGTLEGWKKEVATPCAKNSRPALAICCGLAAPMLTLVGVAGGGINYTGGSSLGKSTTAKVGASTWGSPASILSWEATSVGIEQHAVARNDSLMVLDEMGLASAATLGRTVYQLVSGMERMRGTKTVTARPAKNWTTFILSTTEKGLGDKLSESGEQIQAGQEVRLVDVPICPPGQTQAFEDPAGHRSTEALATHLNFAVTRNYGHAARAFIQVLADLSLEDLAMVRARVNEWPDTALPMVKEINPQVRRVANRFGLVAVAGEMAIEAGILPWTPGTANWAAVECLQSWIDLRGGVDSSEKAQAAKGVLDFLIRESSRFAPRRDDSSLDRRGLAGWYEPSPNGDGRDYHMTPQALKEAIGRIPLDRAVKDLIEAKLIVGTDAKKDRHRGQHQVTVKGGGRPWVYTITAAAREAFEAGERGLPPVAPRPAEITMDDIDL
jgi:putative DNA primase/helicase